MLWRILTPSTDDADNWWILGDFQHILDTVQADSAKKCKRKSSRQKSASAWLSLSVHRYHLSANAISDCYSTHISTIHHFGKDITHNPSKRPLLQSVFQAVKQVTVVCVQVTEGCRKEKTQMARTHVATIL